MYKQEEMEWNYLKNSSLVIFMLQSAQKLPF